MDESMMRLHKMLYSLASINKWVIERADINRISFTNVCTAHIWIKGYEDKTLFINSDGVMNWEVEI